jgi:hypothetical protein
MTHERRVKTATGFVMAGLAVQLASTAYWTPLTFVLFTIIGVPLVLVGVGLYALTVLKILKEKQAL